MLLLFFCVFWQNFHEIDTNKDGKVTYEEIYDIKYDDIDRLLGYIDDSGEGEEEDDSTDGTGEQESQSEESSNYNNQEMADDDKVKDQQHTEL